MRVFCDFDGTISIEDATDLVLSRFADPSWQVIEEQWKQGLVGSAECMRLQIALVRASRKHLDALLDEVSIDPGFPEFLSFCIRNGVPVTIVSDGVDYFIKRILGRHGIHSVPVVANVLVDRVVDGCQAYALLSPFSRQDCASGAGVCKCHSVAESARAIFVGDGRSDFCVSGRADVVFAKGILSDHCAEHSIPFTAFEGFADLTQKLEEMLPALAA